jgi:hypothetical protein
MRPNPQSLLALLGRLPDRRRRQGREYPLAAVRNTAINLIRAMGHAFIPDGRRELSARPQHGVALLTCSSER